MDVGQKVVLNEAGIQAWQRNKSVKNIPPGSIMEIVSDEGYGIFMVKSEQLIDYYFDYCFDLY
jgi:hypothetical protein